MAAPSAVRQPVSGARRLAKFGPFEFDFHSGELRKQGIRIQLQPKPQQLLASLLEQPGAVVNREELRRRLWGDGVFVDFDGGLNSAANRLRITLGDSADSPRYVETLAKTGYRFIAPVEIVEWSATPEVIQEPEAAPAGRTSFRWRWPLALLALAVCGLLAAYLLRPSAKAVRFHQVTFRRGQVSSARFGPGGEILYTALWDSGPRNLYLTSGGGPESRLLGFPDRSLASISPRGELALLSGGGTMNISGATLFRVPMDGTAQAFVDRGVMSADWSRDGERFALVRAADGTNRLEFPAGSVRYETSGWLSSVRISPDGKRIAFIEHPIRHDDSGRLMICEPPQQPRALMEHWASVSGMAWRSGTEIWFTGARDGGAKALWAVTTRGALRLLSQAPGSLTLRDVAPDGRALLTRDTRRLEMAGRLAGESEERDYSWLDWSRIQEFSPDGSQILFDESGEASGPHSAVYIRNLRDGRTTRLADGIAMAFSPDGQRALVAAEDRKRLREIPAAGGASHELPDTGLRYQWAKYLPRKRKLVGLASAPKQGLRLYLQDLDNSAVTALSPGTMIRNAAVSPDGNWLAALSDRDELVLYPTDASGAARTIVSGALAPIGWTADGRWILVQHLARANDSTANVSRVDVRTGRVVPWKKLQPSDRVGVNSITGVAVSGDGESYVYSYRRVLSELFVADGL